MAVDRSTARGTTAQDTRQQNLAAVLQLIFREREPSRADIARLSGLTRPTVSSLVTELIESGLVIELGTGTSAGGKPPTILGVRPEARSIVTVDLSRRPMRGAIADLTGALSGRVTDPGGPVTGTAAVDRLLGLVDDLVVASPSPVIGIGIGTPGLVDTDGTVIEASNLGWHGLPLADRIGTAVGLPVFVANDADAAAFASIAAADDGEGRDVVALRIGQGVGAGVVLDGVLRHGAASAAGELGHVVIDVDGPACACGNAGCLETFASVPAIVRAAGRVETADPGAALARATTDAAIALARALAPVVGLLDVERIVLDCELGDGGVALAEDLGVELRRRLLPAVARRVSIDVTDRGDELVLTGVAAIALRASMGVMWR